MSPTGDSSEVDDSLRNRGEKSQLPDVRIRHVRLMGNVLETKGRTDNEPLHARKEQHRTQTTIRDESDDRKQPSQVSPSHIENRTMRHRTEVKGVGKLTGRQHERDRTATGAPDRAHTSDVESIKVKQNTTEEKTQELSRDREEVRGSEPGGIIKQDRARLQTPENEPGLEEQLHKRESARTTDEERVREKECEREREREIQQRLARESGRQREYSQSTIDVSCVSLAEKTEEDELLTIENKLLNDAWISDRHSPKADIGHSVVSSDSPNTKSKGIITRINDEDATLPSRTPQSTKANSTKQRPERAEISQAGQVQRPIIKQNNGVASKPKHVTIASEVKTSSPPVSAVPKPTHKQHKPAGEKPPTSALQADQTRQTAAKRVHGNVKDQTIERTESNRKQLTTKRASTLKTRQNGNELKASTVNTRESPLPVTRPVKETTARYTNDADTPTSTGEESEDDDVFMKAMKKYGIQLDSDSD